jgi:PAS domain S-box-containing protein
VEPSVERAINLLLTETASVSGQAYLQALVRGTASILGTRHAFIGRAVDAEPRVKVLAFWSGDEFDEPFEYELKGTPCELVAGQQVCQYPQGVQALFPLDTMLEEMGIDAYFGMPIARRGETLGLLVALNDAPTTPVGDLERVLSLFAQRAALEIERMEAERALERSEQRHRQLVTLCTEGIWSIDASGHTDYVNEPMAEMLGVRPAEMLGRSLFDFMDEQPAEQARRNLQRRRQGITERHEFRLRRADGSDVWTQMSTSPIRDDAGGYAGALAFVTDVTEQRRLDESMQRKQKLESLGMLAGGIAHDFNNLLVGILSNADLALRGSDLPPRLRGVVEDIQLASLRASELTRQLLAYAGRNTLHFESLSLPSLAREAASIIRSALAPGVTLELQLDEPLPPVRGDASQLTQVLMNLLTNAGDAVAEQGGSIRVRGGVMSADDPRLARGRVLDALDSGPHVWLSVRDDGVGMDEETAAHVFDPFFTTKEHGHGLGLAAVLGILRRHQGDILVDSTPGSGSELTILLPVAPQDDDRADAAPTPEQDARLDGRRVLIVDDEPMVRRTARMLLELEGVQVDEAGDGADALRKVGAGAPSYDALLIDMTMPGMGGVETLRELRAAGLQVPVVMTSGHSDEAMPDDPGVRFLSKPFRAATLLEVIREAVWGPERGGDDAPAGP